ncbi:MAG: membrane protein insertase YidC [Gammaproteobacteria bacterium]|nr:membrane protein insertase YidC [Gammaproteobacteria bacterium]
MESYRGFLLLALGFISFLLYQQWQEDYATKPEVAQSKSAVTASEVPAAQIPVEGNQETDIPSAKPESKTNGQNLTTEKVILSNDVIEITVDTFGGDVTKAKLLQFNKKLNNSDDKVVLLTEEDGRLFVARSGILGDSTPDSSAKRATYKIIDQQSKGKLKQLTLSWTNEQGVEFQKIFSLEPESYQLKVDFKVVNQSDKSIDVAVFNQLNRDRYVVSEGNAFGLQAYTGAAYSSEDTHYEKYEFEDMDDADLNIKTKGGWIAYLQHYFLTAWIPDQNGINQISTVVLNQDNSIIRVVQQWVNIGSQAEKTISSTLYVGPKNQDKLESIAKNLDRTVDYGVLWLIGQPLFVLLTFFQAFVINWGLAIILVTITVKLLLYPLANAQYKSFAKMRMLQPKLQQLKERYGEDRQKMSMAMMEMYKKEKVNPMGGCLPLLIQMPVFLALYWVLMESYEIRHAPFIFWIQDLSSKDPFFVLPVLMGISMWGMQKLQPTAATMDPMQQKIMQLLPVMMTAFMAFFPSGLVLYWLVNNILSIAQQLYITNKIEKEYQTKKA